MSDTVEQPAEFNRQPLLALDGHTFHRIVVDHVTALDGVVYQVLFILTTVDGGWSLSESAHNTPHPPPPPPPLQMSWIYSRSPMFAAVLGKR